LFLTKNAALLHQLAVADAKRLKRRQQFETVEYIDAAIGTDVFYWFRTGTTAASVASGNNI